MGCILLKNVLTVPETNTSEAAGKSTRGSGPLGTVLLALLPLGLLVGVLYLIALVGFPATGTVPVEDLAMERLTLSAGYFTLTVRNVGPEPVTVAQVVVNDMLVTFEGGQEIGRLRSDTITVPFEWVEGEPYEVTLITEKAFKFSAGVDAAVVTPEADARTLGTLALLGLYIGAIPVLLGLLWRPLLSRVKPGVLNLFLGITVGLLIFLAADALFEGLEIADELPAVFHAPILLLAGAAGAFGILTWASQRSEGRSSSNGEGRSAAPLVVATLIALGIGLHNFAEGLAVGGAFALGEVALGAFLVIGFAVHNTTEGLAIVAPLGRTRTSLVTLLGLGLLAGLPTVLGAWIGGLSPSPYLALVFLGIGAGAIFQVSYLIDAQTKGSLRHGKGLLGVALGVALMYLTSLVIAV